MLIRPRFRPFFNYREVLAAFLPKKNAVKKFELAFAQKFNSKFAVAFPYGRSAQWAFFKALGIKDAEVIMPAYTCSVVAHAVTLSDNTPIFVDIELETYNMNLDCLPQKINANTKAIIFTHTFGFPQNMDRVQDIIQGAERKFGNKIWIINDCCHCFGATYNDKLVSDYGDISIFAFNISKYISSIFGGMVITNNEVVENKIRSYRERHFKSPGVKKYFRRLIYFIAVFFAFRQPFYTLAYFLQIKTNLLNTFTDAYHLDNKIHFPPDYIEKMSNLEGKVGLVQLAKYDDIKSRRLSNVMSLHKKLNENKDFKKPEIVNGATFSHYPVRVGNREEVVQKYIQQGVEVGILIQYSIPDLKCYEACGEYPNANYASQHMINLPIT